MKYFSFVFIILFSLSSIGSDLKFLSASHSGDIGEKNPARPISYYSITAKAHKLLLTINEPLFLGDLKKEYPVLSRDQVLQAKPYVLKECLKDGYMYFLAGDLFKTKNTWFEGVVVGIPEVKDNDNLWSVYLCQIHRNRGKLSKDLGPELGKFFLGYGMVTQLKILSFDPYGFMPLHLRKEEL